jgi:O-antigen/teichoic acid export membrane protein
MAATSRIVATAAGALATVLLARLLGPGSFGTYALAASLIALLVAATTLGIEHGIAYYVGAGAWEPRAAHSTALKVSATAGLAGAVVGMVVRLLFPSAFAGLSVGLTVVAVAALPFALVGLYSSYIALATDRYETYMFIPAFQAGAFLVLAALGAGLFGVSGAVIGLTASAVIVGVASAMWGMKRLPEGEAGAPGVLRRAISFGMKGYAANALGTVSYRADLFILAAVASAAAVGSYATAVAATSLLWLLPRALSDVLYPRVARLSTTGDDAALEMVETKSLRHVSLMTIVTVPLLVVALEFLVVPIFGPGYEPAINLALILLPGVALTSVTGVLVSSVVGRGKPMYTLYAGLVTLPLTLALYAGLIPWLEASGAALASSISYLFSFLLISWYYRRLTGRRVLPLLIPTGAEVDDLRALPRVIRRRAGSLWGRVRARPGSAGALAPPSAGDDGGS